MQETWAVSVMLYPISKAKNKAFFHCPLFIISLALHDFWTPPQKKKSVQNSYVATYVAKNQIPIVRKWILNFELREKY